MAGAGGRPQRADPRAHRTGKTLAAVGGPLIDALLRPERGLQLLWITPLRSLATDTAQHLTTAVAATGLPWRLLRRTGDSSSSERAKLRRGDCELLVTTPESLALLLSYPDAAGRFKHLRGVVVDEWHELIGNKRGTLLQLGLSRLRTLQPAMRVWGLSATLGNLDEALAALAGDGVLIGGGAAKRTQIQTAWPDADERNGCDARLTQSRTGRWSLAETVAHSFFDLTSLRTLLRYPARSAACAKRISRMSWVTDARSPVQRAVHQRRTPLQKCKVTDPVPS